MNDRNPLPPPGARPPAAPSAGDDQLERIAQLRTAPAARPGDRSAPARASRHRHPARGARAVALVASVAATGGVAGAIAAAERSTDDVSDGDPDGH